MARVEMPPLDADDPFPTLELDTVDHGRLTLPAAFDGSWGVLLVYRAHW